jgi:hypothetical protein
MCILLCFIDFHTASISISLSFSFSIVYCICTFLNNFFNLTVVNLRIESNTIILVRNWRFQS